MAYNEGLANKIRGRFASLDEVEEKEMMGGLTFMYNGKMCVGVIKDELMCGIDPAMHNTAIEKPGCRTMDFTKRPMSGYIMVEPAAMHNEKDFEYWIGLALNFNKHAKSSKKEKRS